MVTTRSQAKKREVAADETVSTRNEIKTSQRTFDKLHSSRKQVKQKQTASNTSDNITMVETDGKSLAVSQATLLSPMESRPLSSSHRKRPFPSSPDYDSGKSF